MSLLRGLFDGDEDEIFSEFASSLDHDLLIVEEDIEGSLAHVAMLGETGILSQDEASLLADGLHRILAEFRSGEWIPDDSQEDIHMAVEARLTKLVGAVGGKLHTARSRNDQVATAVRLWSKRRFKLLAVSIRELVSVLLDRVEADGAALIPGYTHLQRGQPVLLGHHLLAHCWALSRDLERVQQVSTRMNACPLGACAMAGTSHPIDPHRTAEILGFAAPMDNAMDAAAARDHLQEAAAVCSILMANLSRMAEELVLWSTSEFRLVRLGDRHSTSSSIMPQKRNPDGAELIRGQAAAVFGHLQALLVLTKGLPMAYNRDLQQERGPLIETTIRTIQSVRLMAACWRDLEVNSGRFEAELTGDACLATELADCLVERGVPFREAHSAVARAVRWCEEQGGDLRLLDQGAANRFHEEFPADLSTWLDPRAAAERRRSHGGTAPAEIARQVASLRRMLHPTDSR